MPPPDHDPISEEITQLLRRPIPPVVQEFALMHLYAYRDEALAAARSNVQRTAREKLVADARLRLRDRLRSLLAWAKETGRLPERSEDCR